MSAGEPTIDGVLHTPAFHAGDPRGRFVKVWTEADDHPWDGDWAEVYHSTSQRGVVRGMHLQVPPHDHRKAVHCLAGRALDVVVDVRAGSPTFGRWAAFELSADEPSLVVAPPGCAHGFQALDDGTVMLYLVTSAHAPDHDTGIRFDSFGFDWPLPPSAVSERDRALPTLEAFAEAGHGPWRP